MFIVLEVLLVLGLVGLVANYLLRGRRDAERQQVIERRVEAYMQTIRREGGDTPLNRMNDVELRDVLLSAARNLRVQAERRWYLVFGGGVGAVIAAIAVGGEQGLQGFALVVVVAAVALYGLNEFVGRRMREPLAAQGIDAERLRVE